MAGVSTVGLDPKSVGEVRVGFRSGWVRSAAVTFGGAGVIGLAGALVGLVGRQPGQMFDLLQRWGFVWLLALAAMVLVWDLAKLAIGHLAKLADSVQMTAVAMNRIADRDDRERERMITETAYIGQRLEKMADQMREDRDEQRAHNQAVLDFIRSRQ